MASIFRQQYGAIYDLISEGPIEGLVNGQSSVYYNETPTVDGSAQSTYGARIISTTTSANSTTVTATSGTFGDDDVGRYIGIPNADASGTTSASFSAGDTVITSSSSMFLARHTIGNGGYAAIAYIRIAGAGPNGGEYQGRIIQVRSGTEVLVTPALSTNISSGAAITVDYVGAISSVTNSTTAVLSRAVPLAVTNVRTQVFATRIAANTYATNFSSVSLDFKTGGRDQAAASLYGAPSDSFIVGDGQDIKWYDKDSVNEILINPLDSQGLALSRERSQEISKVTLTLEFPAGLLVAQKDGDIYQGVAEFQVYLDYKRSSTDASYETALIYGRSNPPSWLTGTSRVTGYPATDYPYSQQGVIVTAPTRSSFVTEIDLNLDQYAPFYEWRLRLRRRTPEDAKDYVGSSKLDEGYNFVGATRLKSIEASTNNIFRYPNSAYALVTFSAEDFDTPPNRAYHIRGKKVKVPSNYITREEAGGNEAKYTRNKTTGVDTGSYVTWDGSFRGDRSLSVSHANYEPVYTNNPAWIFYDILTNKDYGIGDFVQDADIDKYSLYQIARYCDELVDDGNGGLEPRFTCNVYFTSKQEAYKVLKDLASVFRGMMYWIDGQITAVQDRPKEPVYTFTKGNVIDGMFSYESTGQRARINQVNVTWNNPDELYKQSVLTVDDIDDIANKGRIVSKDVVAFGCTSEGQALRVGRWHLLTDTLETELVKFQTSINAGFLRPGDVINVQDAKLNAVEFSGRTSTGSTTTSIELDRDVILQSGQTYNLYLIFPEPGCYLQQASATINSVAYERGDLILTDAGGAAIETAEDAANLVDDSGNKVYTSFNANTRLEKKEITTSAGTVSTLTVSSAFSSAPGSEVIWAVSNVNEYQRDDAVVRYRILGIAEDENNLFSIVASKVIFEKYDEVEKSYQRFVEQYKPTPSRNDEIPAPTELKVELLPTASPVEDVAGVGQKVVVSWNEPVETFTDSLGNSVERKYQFIDSYEIQHNFKGAGYDGGFETVPVSASTNSVIFDNVTSGNYTVKIRTRSVEGQRSPWLSVTQLVKASDQTAPTFDRATRIILGGNINSPVDLDSSTGVVSITNANYKFVSSVGRAYNVISATTAQSEIDFSALSSGASAYWYFDYSDTTDPWKTMVLHTDATVENSSGSTIDFAYWKELGAGNNGLSLVTGTVTGRVGSSIVTGSGTSFTTDFAAGDLIKLSPNNSYTEVAGAEYAEVSRVESDTILHLKGNLTKEHTSQYAYKQLFKPDFINDNILAEVTNTSGTFSIEYYVLKSGRQGIDGETGRTVNLTADAQAVQYSTSGGSPDPDTVTITATAVNTSGTPYYEFLVGGSSVQNNTTNTYDYGAPSAYTSLPITVEVRLREGSDTAAVVARDQITLFGIKAGQSAISTVLSNESHVLFETESGTVDYTGSGTSIEVFEGNTQLSYDGNASPANGTFKVTAAGTNITVGAASTSGDARVYAAHSAITSNSASVVYTITVTRADGTTETITRTQSLTKVQEGAAARNVTLTVTDQSISYDTNGANPDPSPVTFTATARNMQDTAYYTFFVDGSEVQASSTTATYEYTVPTAFTSLPVQVSVEVREGAATGTVVAQDFVTVIGTKPGENAITIILTNESHTLPTTTAGVVTYTGSGTDIQVYEGNTQLTVDQSIPYTSGTFRVSAVGSNITVGAESEPNTTTIRYANHSSMTANNASVTYTIDVVKADGTTATFTRVQSLSKANQGATGAPGVKTALVYAYQRSASALTSNAGDVTVNLDSGLITTATLANGWSKTIPTGSNPLYVIAASAAGTGTTDTVAAAEWSSPVILSQNGAPGSDGLNTATVFIYQRTTSNSAPALPTGDTTYTFSSGAASFTNANGWSRSIPSSGGAYLWISQATAAAASSTDTIAQAEWAAAVLLSQDGATGAAGLRTVQGYLYFEFDPNATGAPGSVTAPSGNTYTFSTGVVSGTGINDAGTINVWKNTPNVQDPTSTNTHYTIRYYGTESSANSSTITVTYSGVVQYTNFSGVVTFSGGTFSEGGTAITTIDGGNISTGTITTEKLRVTGRGSALNSDPNVQDSTAWVKFGGSDASFITISDGEVGNNVIRSGTGGAGSWYNGSEKLALDPSKTYRMTALVRKSATANGTVYVGVAAFDASGNNISGDGSQWSYDAVSGGAGSTSWTRYTMEFGAGTSTTFPSNAVTFAPLVILNYSSTTGYFEAQDIRIEEMLPASLIVDGAITAAKIKANDITTSQLSVGVTNSLGKADTAQQNDSAKTAGTVGGWNVDSSAIYSGTTKDTSTGYTTNQTTISSSGEIHTPFFYSTSSGAGFRGTLTIGQTDLTALNTLNENTTALQVGLGNVANKNEEDQLKGGFAANTIITAGSIVTGNVTIDGGNGRILITD